MNLRLQIKFCCLSIYFSWRITYVMDKNYLIIRSQQHSSPYVRIIWSKPLTGSFSCLCDMIILTLLWNSQYQPRRTTIWEIQICQKKRVLQYLAKLMDNGHQRLKNVYTTLMYSHMRKITNIANQTFRRVTQWNDYQSGFNRKKNQRSMAYVHPSIRTSENVAVDYK